MHFVDLYYSPTYFCEIVCMYVCVCVSVYVCMYVRCRLSKIAIYDSVVDLKEVEMLIILYYHINLINCSIL